MLLRCPKCDAPIAELSDLQWQGAQRVLLGRGHVLVLGPKQAQIFDRLWRDRRRRTWSADQLVGAIYADDPDGGPNDPANSVRVMVRYLRRELAPFGLSIRRGSKYYPGYVLEEAPQLAEAA